MTGGLRNDPLCRSVDRLEAPSTAPQPPGPWASSRPCAHYVLRPLLAKAAIAASNKQYRTGARMAATNYRTRLKRTVLLCFAALPAFLGDEIR